MAIDSSIWIYQFQATMRDKEGRGLVNAHVVGFLRRICKLLFYGIKPVFVFDGGAATISAAKGGSYRAFLFVNGWQFGKVRTCFLECLRQQGLTWHYREWRILVRRPSSPFRKASSTTAARSECPCFLTSAIVAKPDLIVRLQSRFGR